MLWEFLSDTVRRIFLLLIPYSMGGVFASPWLGMTGKVVLITRATQS